MSENKPTPESTCPAALPFMITDQEMKDLMRFHECATDGEGYDVPKERMKQLAEIGLLRRVTSGFYEHTTFGLSVINGDFQSADEIRKQRDELLAALEKGGHSLREISLWDKTTAKDVAMAKAAYAEVKAAIASVKGGAA